MSVRSLFLCGAGLTLAVGLLWLPFAVQGAPPEQRTDKAAVEAAYEQGLALQQQMDTLAAIEAYKRALRVNPFHGKANYEIGWSYWVLRDYGQVVRHWEVALRMGGGTPELPEYLAMARERLVGKTPDLVQVPIGTRAAASGGGPSLELAARFQHYNPRPAHGADQFDKHVFSPKSVIFSPDGGRVYVNALEGHSTIVYDPVNLRKRRVIVHRFGEDEAGLFDAEAEARFFAPFAAGEAPSHPSRFMGKPVESVFSNDGRYLWISYYRRSYDKLGRLPSALAAVEAASGRIVRVLPTGPIPKSLAVSPDGKLLAVIHWGNNTVGLIDTGGGGPETFAHAGEIVVERRLPLRMHKKVNRDHYCGFCLRGGVFTSDGRYLLVGRMGGGGIAVLDVPERRHVGTVWGMKPTPRHLARSRDGQTLYVGSGASGYIAKYHMGDLVAAAKAGRRSLAPIRQTRIGRGIRTIALGPRGRLLYAVVHHQSELVALDADSLRVLLEIAADSFPVGLAVSPDGAQVWVTSQGLKLRGGNSVSVYAVGGGRKP